MEESNSKKIDKSKKSGINFRKAGLFVFELIKIAAIAAAIVVPIRYYLFQPFFVRGESMDPNFENGDYLIIDEISYRFREPARGEVIVFNYPYDNSQKFIKRIIGLPGETLKIKEGEIRIYSEEGLEIFLDESDYLPGMIATVGETEIKLGYNQYFVLGDNRQFSFDSRRFGPIVKENIIGKVAIRMWPFDSLSLFESPNY